jgi:capsular exopolysaccharide synthesis family protein
LGGYTGASAMEVLALAQVVLRRWWLLVLFGALGVACAYLAVSVLPKRYQSSVSLQLNPAARSALLPYTGSNSDQVAPSAVATLAASYSEVLRSRTFGSIVVDRLKLPIAPEDLSRSVEARLVPNTNILRLSVTWDQPQDAQQLAQRVAELFISENVQASQNGTVQRIQQLQESARQMQTRTSTLQQQRDRLDDAVSRGDLSRLTELNDLDTRLAALQTSYTNALVEIERAQSGIDTAAVLDNATPGIPVGILPLPQALLLGLLAGLAVGTGLALLLDRLVGAIYAPEDIAAVCGSAPLAAVGRIAARARSSSGPAAGRLDPRLVVITAPRSASAEAFRTLRANLRFAALEHSLGTIVVTSAGVGDGKTLVSTNLAAAMAQAGQRVLVIDGDLRRPAAHRILGVDRNAGLVEALLSEHERAHRNGSEPGPPSSDRYVVATSIEDLFVLPAGTPPPNPSEILGSASAARLLHDLAQKFDMLVIDSPPVGPVADALLLTSHADGVLVVARAGQTRQDALRGALEALASAGKPILGVVMNDLRPTPLSRYSPYRYYYAGYYGNHYYLDDRPNTNGNGHVKQDAHAPRPSEPASVADKN